MTLAFVPGKVSQLHLSVFPECHNPEESAAFFPRVHCRTPFWSLWIPEELSSYDFSHLHDQWVVSVPICVLLLTVQTKIHSDWVVGVYRFLTWFCSRSFCSTILQQFKREISPCSSPLSKVLWSEYTTYWFCLSCLYPLWFLSLQSSSSYFIDQSPTLLVSGFFISCLNLPDHPVQVFFYCNIILLKQFALLSLHLLSVILSWTPIVSVRGNLQIFFSYLDHSWII